MEKHVLRASSPKVSLTLVDRVRRKNELARHQSEAAKEAKQPQQTHKRGKDDVVSVFENQDARKRKDFEEKWPSSSECITVTSRYEQQPKQFSDVYVSKVRERALRDKIENIPEHHPIEDSHEMRHAAQTLLVSRLAQRQKAKNGSDQYTTRRKDGTDKFMEDSVSMAAAIGVQNHGRVWPATDKLDENLKIDFNEAAINIERNKYILRRSESSNATQNEEPKFRIGGPDGSNHDVTEGYIQYQILKRNSMVQERRTTCSKENE